MFWRSRGAASYGNAARAHDVDSCAADCDAHAAALHQPGTFLFTRVCSVSMALCFVTVARVH